MASSKINKHDVDESIFHKDNLPTAEQVGAYGDHNVTFGTTELTAGSVLATGHIYEQYE